MVVPGTLIYSIGHELWRSECQQDLLRRQHADVDIELEMLGLAGDKSKQKLFTFQCSNGTYLYHVPL